MSGALDAPLDETLPIALRQLTSPPEAVKFPCDVGGYRLHGMLGRGGMGTVYDAEQLATGRRVALKVLARQLDSSDMRQRFVREGRLAASVSHPHSLYVFGSEEIEGTPVISMEIAGSGTLKDKLDRRGPLPVAEAVDAILDVISGLEAAYTCGVLHRDVKPSNCFVNPDGSVKVGDFGLSVSTQAGDDSYMTAAGAIMGTPAYAAPEQLRGDELDVRADIYSVGATLFTLLTGRAPVEGNNAVQVVANAMNQKPKRLATFRDDVPPGLEKIVARCLAKEPGGRYSDYTTLRNSLLPFSSNEPEPASMKARLPAGWIDYLIAFLVPYAILATTVGTEEFHFLFLIDRTLYSARYHIAFLGLGLLYFSIVEGIWGAGLGKRLKGLRVIRPGGRRPGVLRAFVRILIPILLIEAIRIPILMATISLEKVDDITKPQIWFYIAVCNVVPWLAILLQVKARKENGFATAWDLVTGTRVVVEPTGVVRPLTETAQPTLPADTANETRLEAEIGPYQVVRACDSGSWLEAHDPVLRRQVWLLQRTAPGPSDARCSVARPGRPRWLQKVETGESTWDAFESTSGMPFSSLIENEAKVPWSTLRHWLYDVASELWAATADQTLPDQLSLDQIWITTRGRAVVLDQPWPQCDPPAERFSVEDIAGQQRFLGAIAACVDSTSLPLHAQPVLQNLADGKWEKLSYLAGNLRGLVDKPAAVSRGVRAGSILMLPLYVWILIVVAMYTAQTVESSISSLAWFGITTISLVLAARALLQLLELPLGSTCSHSIFGLAVVDAQGKRAALSRQFFRWAIVWLPLLVAALCVTLILKTDETTALVVAVLSYLLWISAAVYSIVHPNRGLHDRIAGTWVVRR